MLEIVREILVAAPPADVWPLVDDPARYGQWLAFADDAEVLEGRGLGRLQRMYGHAGKRKTQIDQVVTEYRARRKLTWEYRSELLDGKPAPVYARTTELSIQLDPDGEFTLVRLRWRQEPATAMRGRMLKWFAAPEVGKAMKKSLDRLQAMVGGGP